MEIAEFLLARIAEDEYACRFLVDAEPGRLFVCGVRIDGRKMLAECEAKRRIVEESTYHQPQDETWATTRYVLKALALPYADHPDFSPEWRA